ncbi:MAG: branched-chain amino acid ABC transporter permease [Desulfocapsaceae bacterium]|nr:branched-chain amino acid ABC transporter permease [Desulfocapsaceae bacterium]
MKIFRNMHNSGFSPLSVISAAAILSLLLAFPLFVKTPYILHMMILFFLSIIMGESWNILGGYTGQYSVGHAAYFGVGAYTTMMLMQFKQIPPWFGMWAGMVMVVVVALMIGSICFRLRGPYFVLASIAVAEIIRLSAMNLKDITNGAEGILATEIMPLKIGGLVVTDFLTKVPFYYIGLAFTLITILANYLVQHSKLGYYFQAIREDQDAAHSLGINLTVYKNIALAISAVLTSLAGSFYAIYVGFIDPPTVLGLDTSVQIVLICIIGGIGTIMGPVIGSLVLVPLSEALRTNMIAHGIFMTGLVSEQSAAGTFLKENLGHAHALIYGILVVVVILFMPDGVLGFIKKLTQKKMR